MTESRRENRVMVELIKVGRFYPPDIEALTEVSLSVSRGEMLFLTGKSGAGKTTLLRLLCKIELPDKGLVEIDGMDLGKLSRHKIQQLRRRIGMAYQDFKLLPERTVARNIALAMEVTYQKKSFIRRQTKTLLDRLGLKSKVHARTADLSRGEQQRVSIARALANNPDLILADEPTGNLDSTSGGEILDLLLQLNQNSKLTIFMVTHDKEIAQLSHRSLYMHDGEVTAS
ncbi:MAG: ATP-binding cassette domain-containing protein [Desulfobulbaceae bacterium]|nr:ATP-binding cassette domain-containing protein [Desulfobulbaceae bacterium]